MQIAKLMGLGALVCVGVAGATLSPPAANAQHSPVYEVRDGMVDQGTFNGYRRYGNSCLACHGPDGAGSSYAPDLTDSLTRLSYEDFANTVINGRQNVSATSRAAYGAMRSNTSRGVRTGMRASAVQAG